MTVSGGSGGSAEKKKEGDRKKRLRLCLVFWVCTLYVLACQVNYHTQLGSLCEIF